MTSPLGTALRVVKNLVVLAGLLFLFGLTWLSITTPLLNVSYDSQRVEVIGETPADFPYLVLMPSEDGGHDAAIVLHEDLEDFEAAHPGSTFLVPEDERRDLLDELYRLDLTGSEDLPAHARFRGPTFVVKELRPGLQEIRVDARTADDDLRNRGWYDATADAARPRFHESFRVDAVGRMAIVYGTLAALAIWALIGAVWWSRRRRAAAAAAAASAR